MSLTDNNASNFNQHGHTIGSTLGSARRQAIYIEIHGEIWHGTVAKQGPENSLCQSINPPHYSLALSGNFLPSDYKEIQRGRNNLFHSQVARSRHVRTNLCRIFRNKYLVGDRQLKQNDFFICCPMKMKGRKRKL